MNESQNKLRAETNQLVRALQRPERRGRWGELQFRNVIEIAGMMEHVDFVEQSNINDNEGRSYPDAIIRSIREIQKRDWL